MRSRILPEFPPAFPRCFGGLHDGERCFIPAWTSWIVRRQYQTAESKVLASPVSARLDAIREVGHFGNAKRLTPTVSEMKLNTGPGYRLYYTKRGPLVLILLCGGDKSTQRKTDLKRATKIEAAVMISALATVARAQNMSALARSAGITREGLCKALEPDNQPGFATVAKIAVALGYQLALVPIAPKAARPFKSRGSAKKVVAPRRGPRNRSSKKPRPKLPNPANDGDDLL